MKQLRSRDAGPVLAVTAAAAFLYAGFALLRHLHWGTGLDVGIFSQAIWHYGNLETPLSTIKGNTSLLGDHFHPLVAVLAPLSWIRAEATGLLVAQALLVAASIVPVWMFARDRLERWPALAIAAAYALYWGIWAGVEFEFHEVAFAPLLVALAILWGDRRQWVRFGCALGLLLLVKEDMGMLVAFFGIWLLSRRDWRAGAITAVAGIAAYFLVTEVLIPHFAGSHGTFQYWSYDDIGKNVPDAAKHVLTHPWKPFEVGLDHGRKIKTLFLMFAPFLFLSLYSRVAIIAIPILAERMLSTNELYWGTYFHYTLPLAPIVAMAAAAGLANAAALIRADLRARAVLIAAVAMVVLNVVANEGAAHTGRQLNYYRHEPSWEAAARRTVAEVPRNASVATQDFVYPHLAARKTIDIIRPGMARTEYLVFNPFVPGSTGTGNGGVAAYGRRLRSIAPQFRAVRLDDGWLIMKRRAPGDRSRGVLTAAACADLARRARTEGTKSNSKATVRLLCRARP